MSSSDTLDVELLLDVSFALLVAFFRLPFVDVVVSAVAAIVLLVAVLLDEQEDRGGDVLH